MVVVQVETYPDLCSDPVDDWEPKHYLLFDVMADRTCSRSVVNLGGRTVNVHVFEDDNLQELDADLADAAAAGQDAYDDDDWAWWDDG